ncbi:MAG TPA: Hpt domain-containing protein [Acidimicrobiales bacterium]|nr:Hpt domain-containing protein [Acidimicrobiales bacterium]
MLDALVLAEYEQISPGLAAELAELFVEDVPMRLESLRSALRQRDMRTVGQLAHTLKGSSSNLGAFQLASTCAALQSATHDASPSATAALVEAIARDWELVRDLLPAAVEAAMAEQ